MNTYEDEDDLRAPPRRAREYGSDEERLDDMTLLRRYNSERSTPAAGRGYHRRNPDWRKRRGYHHRDRSGRFAGAALDGDRRSAADPRDDDEALYRRRRPHDDDEEILYDDDGNELPAGHGLEEDELEEELEPEEEEDVLPVEVPVEWDSHNLGFRIETHLQSKAPIAVNLGRLFRNSKEAKALLDSGAYLGRVLVRLRLAQSHVSFAVRGESKTTAAGNLLGLKAPKKLLPSVDGAVHAVLSKRAAPGVWLEVDLRDQMPVRETWLSNYPGWAVPDLQTKITKTQGPKLEVATTHPVVGWLQDEGGIAPEDMYNENSVLIDPRDVNRARKAIEDEEISNVKVADARNLSLVFVRAYGKPTAAGAPALNDETELMDDYARDARKRTVADGRRRSPIVIEGEFVIHHGLPADLDAFYGDEDDDATVAA